MAQYLTVAGTQLALPNFTRPDLAYTSTTQTPLVTPGTSYAYDVAGDYYEVVITAFAQLTTDGTVSARAVTGNFLTSFGTEMAFAVAPSTQAASLTQQYSFSPSTPFSYGPVGGTSIVALPVFALAPGQRFVISAVSLAPGDQFMAVSLTTLRVPTGQGGPEPVVEPLFPTPVTF